MNQQSLTILLAVLSAPAFGVLVAKYFRPNATPLELVQELQEERAEDRKRIDALEQNQRILTDYVHALRLHITDGKAPPPPAWPEGMKA